jgi:hypothetical protein
MAQVGAAARAGRNLLQRRHETGNLPLAGVGAEHLQSGGADAALGRRRGTDEGGIVILVGQQAQVGGDVLDFRLVEKGLAAGEQIGNPVVAQILLENTRLMVRAVKDGVVLELAAMLETVRLQLHDHA